MASLKAIRKRIATVKSTQKITRAMKMVAGARLTRAQARIVALRPYAVKTHQMLATVVGGSGARPEVVAGAEPVVAEPAHPYLVERPQNRIAIIVLTSDRGTCGAFNANMSKAVERLWRARTQEGKQVTIYTAGRKGYEYLRRRNAPVVHNFEGIWEKLDVPAAQRIVRTVMKPFLDQEVDAIYLAYSEFKSAMTQRVVIEPLLPVRQSDLADVGATNTAAVEATDFLYEPNKQALLDRLVPMYVEIAVFRALLESMASELGARMTAMDSATKNAKEVIDRLTLAYNRARQAAITKELMEIIGGAEALKE